MGNMIGGFSKYLIDNGWKRYRYEIVRKNIIEIEDYENTTVSSVSGPLEYRYRKDGFNVVVYWGLCMVGHGPKFFIERFEYGYLDVSDFDKAYDDIIMIQDRLNDMKIKYANHKRVIQIQKGKNAGRFMEVTFNQDTCYFDTYLLPA